MHSVSQICSSKDTLESERIMTRWRPRESKIDLRLSWQSVLGTDCRGVYMQNSTNTTLNQGHNNWWGSTRLVHSIRLFFRNQGNRQWSILDSLGRQRVIWWPVQFYPGVCQIWFHCGKGLIFVHILFLYFVAYLVFISSIRVDPGPRNRGPTSLLTLKIRTPVANTGKLRSIRQVPVVFNTIVESGVKHCITHYPDILPFLR
jgi:hypothetical protein